MTRTTSIPSGESHPVTLVSLSQKSERDVLRLHCRCKRSWEIAEELGLTEKTVETYLFRLCQGLGLSGRVELLLWGLQNPGAIREHDPRPARAGLHPAACPCAVCSQLLAAA